MNLKKQQKLLLHNNYVIRTTTNSTNTSIQNSPTATIALRKSTLPKLAQVPNDRSYLFSSSLAPLNNQPSPNVSTTEAHKRTTKRKRCFILNTTKTLSTENSPVSGEHRYKKKFTVRTNQKSCTEGHISKNKKSYQHLRKLTIDDSPNVAGRRGLSRPLKSCLKSSDKRASSLGVFKRLYSKLRFDNRVRVEDGSVKRIKFGLKKKNKGKKGWDSRVQALYV